MTITIQTQFAFHVGRPTAALLQFEAAATTGQTIVSSGTDVSGALTSTHIPALDNLGERMLLQANGATEVAYRAEVDITRDDQALDALSAIPTHALPGEAVQYLFDSRYCSAERFQTFVEHEFGGTSGGARIAAIRDWIASRFSYVPGASTIETGAVDSFISRQGICRDYAHVLVALARASIIPARYVACYGPDVTPQDFHAVAEVYLEDPENPSGGAWHLVDATGMALPSEMVKIGVGRDASDVGFITTFGPMLFQSSRVNVQRS